VVTWLEGHFNIPMDDVDISERDFVSVAAICRFVERAEGVSVLETAHGGGNNDRA